MKIKYYRSKARTVKTLITAAICIVAVIVAFFTNSKSLTRLGIASDFDTEQSFIRVIDVGQAESVLIYSNGYSALLDVGTENASGAVSACLDECGIRKLDVLIISHLHDDHIGGVKAITENYGAQSLILPELSVESECLGLAEAAVYSVTKSGGETYTAKPGISFKIGEFEITVLAAYSDSSNENNRSVVVSAVLGEKSFLFTGDAEAKVERKLINEGLRLKSDILCVGHHGSATSTCAEFLSSVKPEYAAISVGDGNMYGHPHNDVLSLLEGSGAEIFRTDINGDITFNFKNGKIFVSTESSN